MDSLTVLCLCAFSPILPQFYVPFYVKKEKMDNFMCILEFECTKRLKVHSQAIPANQCFPEGCISTTHAISTLRNNEKCKCSFELSKEKFSSTKVKSVP